MAAVHHAFQWCVNGAARAHARIAGAGVAGVAGEESPEADGDVASSGHAAAGGGAYGGSAGIAATTVWAQVGNAVHLAGLKSRQAQCERGRFGWTDRSDVKRQSESSPTIFGVPALKLVVFEAPSV